MKYEKAKDGSYVHNCFIVRRKSDRAPFLFHQSGDGGHVSAFLNGYAIIPLEIYKEMLGEEFDDTNIKEANKQLHGPDVPVMEETT